MKKIIMLFVLFTMTLGADAVSLGKLRSFFNESSVQRYFKYAHPNAGSFEGVEIVRITENRVTVKAAFEPSLLGSLLGGSYTCTIYIDIDGNGRFSNVTYDCDSNARSSWPCFKMASDDLKNRCRNSANSSYAIEYMENHFGKRLMSFNGREAMCTLLNIAWFNYDY